MAKSDPYADAIQAIDAEEESAKREPEGVVNVFACVGPELHYLSVAERAGNAKAAEHFRTILDFDRTVVRARGKEPLRCAFCSFELGPISDFTVVYALPAAGVPDEVLPFAMCSWHGDDPELVRQRATEIILRAWPDALIAWPPLPGVPLPVPKFKPEEEPTRPYHEVVATAQADEELEAGGVANVYLCRGLELAGLIRAGRTGNVEAARHAVMAAQTLKEVFDAPPWERRTCDCCEEDLVKDDPGLGVAYAIPADERAAAFLSPLCGRCCSEPEFAKAATAKLIHERWPKAQIAWPLLPGADVP